MLTAIFLKQHFAYKLWQQVFLREQGSSKQGEGEKDERFFHGLIVATKIRAFLFARGEDLTTECTEREITEFTEIKLL